MRRVPGLCSLILLLSGCAESDLGELDQHLDEILSTTQASNLAPLPEPSGDIAPRYVHSEARSPFQSLSGDEPPMLTPQREAEPERQREPLEYYDLSELTLVGTLTIAAQPSALIRSPEGRVHRLQVGGYLGSNAGRIVRIHNSSIMLEESVPEGNRWVARSREMGLGD